MSSYGKLAKLREQFASARLLSLTENKPLDAYIIPSTDAHQSEYLADYDFRVRYLSGFTGSNAFVVVTLSGALLWTDARYFVQAEQQLDKYWKLMKKPGDISYEEFLSADLEVGSVIGFDPTLFTYAEGKKMKAKMESLGYIVFAVKGNLVDDYWMDRPPLGQNTITVLSASEHGRDAIEKITDLRETLKTKKCNAIILSQLDDIVWLLNIRGHDIPYNPLVYSYLLISHKEAILFIDLDKLDDRSKQHLAIANVRVHDYELAHSLIYEWNRTHGTSTDRILVPSSTNYLIGNLFNDKVIVTETSPVQIAKAVKNPIELDGFRKCSVRDSIALVLFFFWLEQEWDAGRSYTEIELAAKIDDFRSYEQKFVEISFSTISAAGEHAALPHYHSEGEEGNKLVEADNVFLLDSGGHYRDGTTDVTRTIWTRNPSAEFIRANTLVLMGHIELAQTIFPSGILGVRLDSFTRHALWQQGLDFGHGTGHGVGHFLNVHEGPIGIGHRSISHAGELREGNILTIEPGYYLPGSYGIRIENCYELVRATRLPSAATNFLAFNPLTLVPIQTSIVDKSLMTEKQIAWLNSYHDRVFAEVGGYLLARGRSDAYQWLKKQCVHI